MTGTPDGGSTRDGRAPNPCEDRIPAALKAEEQWVAWRTEPQDGKPTKVPVNPSTGAFAKVNNPETWTGFDTALHYYNNTGGIDGVGFVFSERGPFVGVDFDDVRDPDAETVVECVLGLVHRLDSYTERSPTGTGYHVIMTGTLPVPGTRSDSIEIYAHGRYFTVTGDHVPGFPTRVEHRHRQLQSLYNEVADTPAETAIGMQDRPINGYQLSDSDLIEKALNAANGDKFQQLWSGDTSGYPSHSEADLALAAMLAFWTGGDPQRIERLFERSGLVRDKWKERPDYRKRTIRKAIAGTEFYEPK